MIRIEVNREADVTKMVVALTALPYLADDNYEIYLIRNEVELYLRAWRRNGVRGATNPTDRSPPLDTSGSHPCLCGYPGSSADDLEQHIVAASGGGPEHHGYGR